jgi:hypothetical protein
VSPPSPRRGFPFAGLCLALIAGAVSLAAPASAAAACPAPSSSYSTAVAASAVGYWQLGDAPGGGACATKGTDGTYGGGATRGQAGIPGTADTSVGLDGTGFMSVPDSAGLDPARNFSLEAWVKPAGTAGSQSVVRKDGQYYLKIYDGKLQLWLWSNPTTRTTFTTASAVMTAGTWQHLVVTFNGSSVLLYRNGTSVGSFSKTLSVPTTSNPLRWGDSFSGGADQNFLTGGVDEVAVYDQVLAPATIASHYTSGSTPPSPPGCTPRTSSYSAAVLGTTGISAYWRLGEASGTTACASKGPNGTYVGGVTLGAAGAPAGDPDTSISLDGSSGRVEVPNAAALNPTTGLTLEAWVKPNAIALNSHQTILRKDGEYYFKVYEDKLQFWLWTSATTKTDPTSDHLMTAGTWQHVVVTYDGSTVRFYRNGVAIGTVAVSVPLRTNANPLHLGASLVSGNETNFLAGGLDEVAIYDRALSAADVAAHYQTAVAATP